MSRAELAHAVNAHLHRVYGVQTCVDETYIGKLERGTHRWPQERYRDALRSVLGATTDAQLGFYITRVQGQPGLPPDEACTREPIPAQGADNARRQHVLEAGVGAIRQVLIEGYTSQRQRLSILDGRWLKATVSTMRELRAACDYEGFISKAPGVFHGLHATAKGPSGKVALASLLQVSDELSFVMRHLGFPADAWLAAEHARAAAELVETPVMSGLAAWTQSQAALTCLAHQRAFDIASDGIDGLSASRTSQAKPELEGQLHLTCAYALAHLGRVQDAMDHLSEARKAALATGETKTFGLMFGPTNVSFWYVSFHAQWGDPATAISIARQTRPDTVRSISRQAAFFIDLAKALALEGNAAEALRALDTVAHLAPQKYASSPEVANLLTVLTYRPHTSVGRGRSHLAANADISGSLSIV